MIGGAFVANRRGRYNNVPDAYGSDEDSGPAACNELTASERDHVLQAGRRAGSADSGMNNGEPLASIIELIDRVIARLALAVVYLARLGTLTNEVPNHLLEEAQYTVFCDVDGFDDTTWFDDRDARTVTLKKRYARDGRVLAGTRDWTGVARAARICELTQSVVNPRELKRLSLEPTCKTATAGLRFRSASKATSTELQRLRPRNLRFL